VDDLYLADHNVHNICDFVPVHAVHLSKDLEGCGKDR